VKRFRSGGHDHLGSELRANRPEPSSAFLEAVSERITADSRPTRLRTASRLSFAGAITVLMLGTLASFGGLGYAASSTKGAFVAVKRVVAPSQPQSARNTAAADQYQPQKITICHKGHTITIAKAALPAHLRHGDTIGPCGGVLGASAARIGGAGSGGVLGASATSGTLPFTGISLAATVLLAVILMALGFALRRRADRKT
jgi:hypothetical protein